MKIKKEYVLIVLIIIGVVFLEWLTSKISNKAFEKISIQINEVISELEKLHDSGQNLEQDKNNIDEKIKKLKSDWKKEEDKLSIFAEHNEVEKVTACLVLLEENTKNEQYDDALANGKEFIYRLEYITEKDDIKLKNVF